MIGSVFLLKGYWYVKNVPVRALSCEPNLYSYGGIWKQPMNMSSVTL